jgi:ABC-type branched-subunit amino acid transport system substrate-binding protein
MSRTDRHIPGGCSRGIVAAFVVIACSASVLRAAEGAARRATSPPENETVLLGMSAALTGPTSSLGLGMREGVEAAILEANQAPAHAGRTLKLVALDDGYEPARTGPAMRQCLEILQAGISDLRIAGEPETFELS